MMKLAKGYPLYRFQGQLNPVKKYARKGKPAAGDEATIVGYTLDLVLERNEEAVSKLMNKKGRFILATNDMDAERYPATRMLAEYKAQQGVERGFRFLKDPWFMVDWVFLKSPRRIEALMMVMTLCLLVYNVAQYHLRDKLKTTGETLPNQLEKEVQNPTLRWIFKSWGVGDRPDRVQFRSGQFGAGVGDEHDVAPKENHPTIRAYRLPPAECTG